MSRIMPTSYISHPVDIPEDFLAPLPDPSVIKVERVDFEEAHLPEYSKFYAVVLDNVLSKEECDALLHMTEMSAGAHHEDIDVPDNGWKPALVSVGAGYEFKDIGYRNSDRIIWDEKVLAQRLWQRVLQGEGIKEYLLRLEGEEYHSALGTMELRRDGKIWEATEQCVNERLRFLKYGAGQYFKQHCDSPYGTPDGKQRSFYTIHLYLNDSAEALGITEPYVPKIDAAGNVNPEEELLRGGATTFYSRDMHRRIDINPKVGRILIFQHTRLLHAGDTVISGIKYTMRSDLMYGLTGRESS